MSRIGQPPRRALSAKDVSDLQLGPGHPVTRLHLPSFAGLIPQLRQHLVGAHCVADHFGSHMGVLRGRRQPGVTEQCLNDAHIRIGLKQVRGKAVPERV